jgi:multimeric flavodoxin WrbA
VKVLLLRANPRKTGYTQRLIDLFARGLSETSATVTDVDLARKNISQCHGCYHCWLGTPGKCVQSDDMGLLLDEFVAANVVVCATPLYFYSMSSALKIFFERTIPLTREGLTRSRLGGMRNNTRYPEHWEGKTLIAIITGALTGLEVFRPAIETFKLIADGLGIEDGGQIARPESYMLDYPFSKPLTLKRIETAVVQAGREAGTLGRLSPETMADASLPLASDPDRFFTYSNHLLVAWPCPNGRSRHGRPPAVQARVSLRRANPHPRNGARPSTLAAAARVKAVLQFDFPDCHEYFRVTVDRGRVELAEAATEKPDLRVRCDARVWAGVFTRQIDARRALIEGQLVLEGDKSLFSRLDRLFPPPST